MPAWTSLSDWLKWLAFELGAGYYARKLATGAEADLRREFAQFLDCPVGARVLDVGCGPGHLARLLARKGCQVTGVDRGRRILRIARKLARREGLAVEFLRAPAEQLPFADSTFDVTFATTVVYFVARPEKVVREMARVTRPEGTLAALDPHASISVGSVRAYSCEMRFSAKDTRKLVAWARAAELNRRFQEQELRDLLARAGWGDVHLERRMGGLVWFARGRAPFPG